MRVRDVMTRKVIGVSPDDDLENARALMRWGGFHHTPVIFEKRVVGMISDRDVLRAIKPGKVRTHVSEAMRVPVVTVSPGDDVRDAAARMIGARVSCLPVVDNDEVVGLVTATDLLIRAEGEFPPDDSPVALVMSKEPVSVHAGDLVTAAANTMARERVRHLAVLDSRERLAGIVSDRDVLGALGMHRHRWIGPEPRSSMRVSSVMTPDPLTIPLELPVSRALEIVVDHRIGALPVVDATGRLAGMVTLVDLLAHFAGSGAVAEPHVEAAP